MQRKLEEHEEALLGRAQVVELLQQELTLAEQRNEVRLWSHYLPGDGWFYFRLLGSRHKNL